MQSLDKISSNKKSGLSRLPNCKYDRISLENIRRPIRIINWVFADVNAFEALSIKKYRFGVGVKFKKMNLSDSDIKYINRVIKVNLFGSLKYSSFNNTIKLSDIGDESFSDCVFTWLS